MKEQAGILNCPSADVKGDDELAPGGDGGPDPQLLGVELDFRDQIIELNVPSGDCLEENWFLQASAVKPGAFQPAAQGARMMAEDAAATPSDSAVSAIAT